MGTHARLWTTARVAGLRVVLGVMLAGGVLGCHRTQAQDAGAANGADPADANLAPANPADAVYSQAPASSPAQPVRVLAQRNVNEAQQQAQDYTPQQAAAPIERRAPGGDYQGASQGVETNSAQQGYDPNAGQQGYDPNASANSADDQSADLYAADLTAEAAADPPPPLPVYEQPPCPEPDDLWTPGYWGWASAGYYWVPGVWVAAPYAGALWTPGYWGLVGDRYRFHHGFWGSHIGFYGGIDYGFGYTGFGYYGGYWRDRHFVYNTAVNRVNGNSVHNVYVRNVVVNNVVVNNGHDNRVSYNGGRGGVAVRPRPQEIAALHEQRLPPMQSQLAVRHEAEGNRAQFFQENHGRPQTAFVARPVAADRTLPAALPQIAPRPQNGVRNGDVRPSQQQPVAGRSNPLQPAAVQDHQYQRGQVQPNGQVHPGNQPGDAARGRGYQQAQPGAQGVPARKPYERDGQPGAGSNGQSVPPTQPNYQGRPSQPNTQPHPNYQPAQPNAQPHPNYDGRGGQPQTHHDTRQQSAPQAAPQAAPHPQSQPQFQQQRPQPQAQQQPRPQPQVQQPRPQARPAPPAGRAEQPREQPHERRD